MQNIGFQKTKDGVSSCVHVVGVWILISALLLTGDVAILSMDLQGSVHGEAQITELWSFLSSWD